MPGITASVPEDALFAQIETALSLTTRGRAFLDDYVQRRRAVETQNLLGAVARLEGRLADATTRLDFDRLRAEFADMAAIIRSAKGEKGSTTETVVVADARRSSAAVLDAAEQIQDTAWTMREGGFDAMLCDRLDRLATDIYRDCLHHAATIGGSERAIEAMGEIERRIVRLTRELSGRGNSASSPLDEPRPVLSDGDLDFVESASDPTRASLPAPVSEATAPDAAVQAAAATELDKLAALSTRDRLMRFT